MSEKQHHRLGVTWSPEVKAKIATSLVISKEKEPDMWQRLYNANLERIKILQEVHAR